MMLFVLWLEHQRKQQVRYEYTTWPSTATTYSPISTAQYTYGVPESSLTVNPTLRIMRERRSLFSNLMDDLFG